MCVCVPSAFCSSGVELFPTDCLLCLLSLARGGENKSELETVQYVVILSVLPLLVVCYLDHVLLVGLNRMRACFYRTCLCLI